MHIKSKSIYTLIAVVVVMIMASCKTPTNVSYFQDSDSVQSITMPAQQMFRLRPQDKINIVVNSKDPSLEQLFTLTAPSARNTIGASTAPQQVAGKSSSGGTNQTIAYTVDSNGNIEFPILGTIKVQGMTRQDVATYIKSKLISQQLVKDPIVTVEYVNLAVSVLGEVSHPGRQDIVRDEYTILDAISQAGDLTINGLRENIKVLRNEGGKMKTYNVNLCSVENVAKSPVYYLQQNDIVYVSPTDKRKRESTVNGNTVLTPSFWISVASLLTTITALILR